MLFEVEAEGRGRVSKFISGMDLLSIKGHFLARSRIVPFKQRLRGGHETKFDERHPFCTATSKRRTSIRQLGALVSLRGNASRQCFKLAHQLEHLVPIGDFLFRQFP